MHLVTSVGSNCLLQAPQFVPYYISNALLIFIFKLTLELRHYLFESGTIQLRAEPVREKHRNIRQNWQLLWGSQEGCGLVGAACLIAKGRVWEIAIIWAYEDKDNRQWGRATWQVVRPILNESGYCIHTLCNSKCDQEINLILCRRGKGLGCKVGGSNEWNECELD